MNAAAMRCQDTPPEWQASLHLAFDLDDRRRTRLVQNRHHGPLRVQRLLHPEANDCAHALILHPPGGIAGRDELHLDLALTPGTRVLCTTPGATKWYHGNRGWATQSQTLKVATDACLEWLPQEAILFDGARARQHTQIEIAEGASLFAWDIVQFGHIKAAAQWQRGQWQQSLHLFRNGRLRFREAVDLISDDPRRSSGIALADHAVLANVVATSPALMSISDDALDALRAIADASGLACGISRLRVPTSLLVMRVLGNNTELVRGLLERLWSACRPLLFGRAAEPPRIWRT